MIDFVLVFPKRTVLGPEELDFLAGLSALRSAQTDAQMHYQTGNLHLWAWHTNVLPHRTISSHIKQENGALFLYDGHALDSDGNPVRTADDFSRLTSGTALGNYLTMRIRPDATGMIARSLVSTLQCYYGEDDDAWVIASRASIAHAALRRSYAADIEPSFVRSVVSYGIAGHYHGLFRDIKFLGFDESVELTALGPRISSTGPAFIHDERLSALYRDDRSRYWDEAYETLKLSLGTLDFSSDSIRFPLSGGKDSRLLLAMLIATGRGNRLSSIYTNGPPMSPEVRSALDVCSQLGLKHEFIDRTNVQHRQNIELSAKLLDHMTITEGEMSPVDMMWQRRPSDPDPTARTGCRAAQHRGYIRNH